MSAPLQSTRISLLFDFELHNTNCTELWQTLKTTAVEPYQVSSADFLTFAQECLLLAQIATNIPTSRRGNTIHFFGDDPPPPAAPPLPRVPERHRIGFIYLYSGPSNVPAQEANIGIVLKPAMRRRGYAREALRLVLRWAFEELKFHRVQAAILDSPFEDRALRLFIGSGFTHEGIKRRSIYLPEEEGMASIWKDVTYLAMLDTDWLSRSSQWRQNNQTQLISLWDEMFARHQREQEVLLMSEERLERTKRPSSAVMLRENVQIAVPDLAYLTDDASSAPPSPKPNILVTLDEDSHVDDISAEDELYDPLEVPAQADEAMQLSPTIYSILSRPTSLGRTLSIPSIPSTRVSEGMLQSPVTIPTFSSDTPPLSLSPTSSIRDPWSDSEDEGDHLLPNSPSDRDSSGQLDTPRGPVLHVRTGTASVRSRPRSVSVSSSSSSDAWSDAQSSVCTNSSTWDVISNSSDLIPRGRAA